MICLQLIKQPTPYFSPTFTPTLRELLSFLAGFTPAITMVTRVVLVFLRQIEMEFTYFFTT